MPDRAQVHPDLVRAARARRGLEQRAPVQALPDLEPGLRGAAGLLVHDDPRPPPVEGGVHGERLVLGGAAHEGEVAAVDLVPTQHRLQGLVRGIVARDQHQARGPSVQPVHDAPAQRTSQGREGHAHPEQPVHERAGPPVLRRVRDHPRRFRDDEEVLVAVAHRHAAGLRRDLLVRRHVGAHELAAGQAERLGARLPVDAHAPGDDRALHVGAREPQASGHDGIEPPGLGRELSRHRCPADRRPAPASRACRSRRAGSHRRRSRCRRG